MTDCLWKLYGDWQWLYNSTSYVDKLKWLRINSVFVLALFLTLGHWGRKPGGDGGGDPAEKAQTQETSGQGLIEQRWRGRQGQEETWTSTSWETLPQPPQTHQANEHHHRYSHQLQRWVRRFITYILFHFIIQSDSRTERSSFLFILTELWFARLFFNWERTRQWAPHQTETILSTPCRSMR